MRESSTWIRIALGATALSLWAYIPYRYATRPPEPEGFVGIGYAVLFPLAGLLALVALIAAWKPASVRRLQAGSRGTRFALGGYGAVWLVMGLLCVSSLTAAAAASPVKGAVSMIHMTAQHVFLGLAAVAVAWRPDVAASALGVEPVRTSGEAGETALAG